MTMELKEHYLEHKAKTEESFKLVSADISIINSNIQLISNEISALRKEIERLSSELSSEKSIHADSHSSLTSKVDDIGASFASGIEKNERSIKAMMPRLKNNSLAARKMGSRLRKAEEEIEKSKKRDAKILKLKANSKEVQDSIRKIKNLLGRKLRTLNRLNAEFEAQLKSHRNRTAQLNRKIEDKNLIKAPPSKKIITKKITPKRIITKEITPKRIITKEITPKKAVTKKITPKKTVTKKVTPKRTVTKTVTPKRTVTKIVTPQGTITETVKQDNQTILKGI